MGEEAVLADSGRVGEIAAGIGRVRSLPFLSILRDLHLLFTTCEPLSFLHTTIVFLQPLDECDPVTSTPEDGHRADR